MFVLGQVVLDSWPVGRHLLFTEGAGRTELAPICFSLGKVLHSFNCKLARTIYEGPDEWVYIQSTVWTSSLFPAISWLLTLWT